MITIKIYQKNLPDSWDQLVDDCAGSWYFKSRWKRVLDAVYNHPSYYLAAEETGKLVGILPLMLGGNLLFGRFLVSLPYSCYGDICTKDANARSALLQKAKEIARSHGVEYLQIRSQHPVGDRDFVTISDKATFQSALNSSPDLWWERLSDDAKRDVRKALSAGCEVRIGGKEYLDDFYHVFCRRMQELGSPVYGKNLFHKVIDIFQDDAKIVLVSKGEKPIGAGFLMIDRQNIEIPWSASLASEFKHKPNHLIYWKAVQYGFERRCRMIDFGTSNQDSPNAAFKLQWCAQKIPLAWSYYPVRQKRLSLLSPKNPKFKLAIELWKKLPPPVADFIGPKLIRGIP